MDNGTGGSDIRDDCHFCVVLSEKAAATGIKSNARCRDAGDECLGRYDASILKKFRPSDSSLLFYPR